jgi:hypothetical protein
MFLMACAQWHERLARLLVSDSETRIQQFGMEAVIVASPITTVCHLTQTCSPPHTA